MRSDAMQGSESADAGHGRPWWARRVSLRALREDEGGSWG